MKNIFEQIREDHETQRALIQDLVETSGHSQTRKDLYEQLKHHLKIHADAEERYFYKPLFRDDLTQDKARHSVAEHHEIDELLEKLDNTEMDNSAWLSTAEKLKERVLHHLAEEEHEVFQMAGKALENSEKIKLGESYREMMEENA
ncbi:hemerythrin domain-containing protein [Cryomorphaceae bacterium 1068]|nr:hemerythrin domain-containing protein [Cryomorphaceae bacterium 1068]